MTTEVAQRLTERQEEIIKLDRGFAEKEAEIAGLRGEIEKINETYIKLVGHLKNAVQDALPTLLRLARLVQDELAEEQSGVRTTQKALAAHLGKGWSQAKISKYKAIAEAFPAHKQLPAYYGQIEISSVNTAYEAAQEILKVKREKSTARDAIAQALTRSVDGLTHTQIAEITGLAGATVSYGLTGLKKQDRLTKDGDRYRILATGGIPGNTPNAADQDGAVDEPAGVPVDGSQHAVDAGSGSGAGSEKGTEDGERAGDLSPADRDRDRLDAMRNEGEEDRQLRLLGQGVEEAVRAVANQAATLLKQGLDDLREHPEKILPEHMVPEEGLTWLPQIRQNWVQRVRGLLDRTEENAQIGEYNEIVTLFFSKAEPDTQSKPAAQKFTMADYRHLKVVDLKRIAQENGIHLSSSYTHPDLVKLLIDNGVTLPAEQLTRMGSS